MPVVRTRDAGSGALGGPIAYAVSGPRAPHTRDLVLVHGWCCDRSAMAPLREELERTHRVVTMDLRGHGQSQEFDEDGSVGTGVRRADQDLAPPRGELAETIEEFAADVRAVCEAAELRDPVVIGHSMGGLVALAALAGRVLAAGSVPTAGSAAATEAGSLSRTGAGVRPRWAPSGAVLLDPAPIANERGKAFWADQAGPVSRDHTGDLRREFARSLVLPTDRANYERIVEVMASVHPAVAAGGATAMATFDGAAVLGALSAPVLVIHAATAERGLEQLAPDRALLTLGRTVGAGHFHQFEVPDQVLSMIERWLAVTFPLKD